MQLRVLEGEGVSTHPTPVLDDAQLVKAISNGNVKLAGAFHDRTRPIVERTIHRLIGHSDNDFDDLVQISLIELLRSLGRFRGECSLDTWITKVASNIVYKHLRRRGLERTLFSKEPTEAHALSTHPKPLLRNMIQRIYEHLKFISPDRAWAFLFHDVYGYSLEEIAAMTGVTVAAAQSRVSRGRRELHQRIASDPGLANRMDRMEAEL